MPSMPTCRHTALPHIREKSWRGISADDGTPPQLVVVNIPHLSRIPYRDTHTGKNTNTQLQYSLYWLLLRLVKTGKIQLLLRGSLWGTNMQQMVSLHQVQRIYIQYFSHSHNIQQQFRWGLGWQLEHIKQDTQYRIHSIDSSAKMTIYSTW